MEEKHVHFIWVLLEKDYIPDNLVEGLIVLSNKGGEETDMGTYRGITLGSHTEKLFGQVLKSRLNKLVD